MNPKKFPKESLSFKDEETGNDIIQLTSHKSVHHHPFFHVNAYNLNQDKLYFISHRSGSPQIMFADMQTENLYQITEFIDLMNGQLILLWMGSTYISLLGSMDGG